MTVQISDLLPPAEGCVSCASAHAIIARLMVAYMTPNHESLESQVDRLVRFIMQEIPSEPSENAASTHIRARHS